MINRLFGNRVGNLIYGTIGVLAGIIFLVLNLSDPANASTSDWVWCVIGFGVGAFLLWRGFSMKS
ncbi:MAG: hypothetical protein J2P37_03650 [Ktedonobacteraceae bacterium]|nr:hypothetical protein [Ktedonobacteraceae bacterium]